ncbi:MAG: hypothetical protein E7436_05555 [Ruminococcaceae bacterium]|nr:hypothetical protein [Oscillospiraceae bacterium]
MKRLKTVILSVLLLGLLLSSVGAGAEWFQTLAPKAGETTSGIFEIEKDGIKLSYDAAEKNFTVTDPYGYVWNSAVYDDLYSSDLLNDLWMKKVRSILYVSYADITGKNPMIKTDYSSDAKILVKEEAGGLRLEFSFKQSDIFLVCEIRIEDGELVIDIPASEIREDDKYKLISVEVLPYFGACGEDEEGYLMYPDGSGAIKYHQSTAPATMSNTWYSWDIYGNDLKTLDTMLDNGKNDLQTAMLPVYGIKKGDHAFIAFSENGEEEGTIYMYPAGYGVKLNRMSMVFRYRTSYDIAMSNININGSNTAQNINGLMYNPDMIVQDHDLHLSFLADDEADYSGMANRYRQILMENGDLARSELVDKIGVAVNILMAASEQGFWSDSIAVTTTPAEAKAIIEYVQSLGFGENGLFNLKGWGKGGYGVWPQSAKPDGKVGSVKDLTALLDLDVKVFLEAELLLAGEANGGFDKVDDAAKLGSQNVITDKNEELFLYNAANFHQRLEKLLDAYKNAEQVNLSLSSIGKVLYRDENKKDVTHRGAVRAELEKLMQSAAEAGTLAVYGANLYTLAYADAVLELPAASSEYFITDQDIPFCQMVLHGSVVYTGEYGNLSSDYDEQLLKWLEYGYTPAFELTHCSSEELKNTNCSSLYTSQYESNRERLEKAYGLYEQMLSKVAGAYITEHRVLEDRLVMVRYSNGYTVLINYSNQAKVHEGTSVAAGSYVAIGD